MTDKQNPIDTILQQLISVTSSRSNDQLNIETAKSALLDIFERMMGEAKPSKYVLDTRSYSLGYNKALEDYSKTLHDLLQRLRK